VEVSVRCAIEQIEELDLDDGGQHNAASSWCERRQQSLAEPRTFLDYMSEVAPIVPSQSVIYQPGSAMVKRLLLFDIDGTLIHSAGAGVQALKNTLAERFGLQDDFHDIEIAGMTDSGIVMSILNKHNIPTSNENIAAFLDSYVHFLSLELPRRAGRLLPGVLELLQRLKTRPNLVLALLTGNISRGAELKLQHYGVWHFFEFGAFADDHHDRNQLGPFARARAREKHGHVFEVSQIDVIGDTPRDIACGKAIGARTIAIATGSSSREKLSIYQPDFLFDDFSNVEEVIATLAW
jgi:phosphoglycolate phosphatase